jgi:hypothetical protein
MDNLPPLNMGLLYQMLGELYANSRHQLMEQDKYYKEVITDFQKQLDQKNRQIDLLGEELHEFRKEK